MYIIELILQLAIMISLGVMAIIAVRVVPRIDKEELKIRGVDVEAWIESLPIDKIDLYIKKQTYKILRKMRLVVLKIDNVIGSYLEKTKDFNNERGGFTVEEFMIVKQRRESRSRDGVNT